MSADGHEQVRFDAIRQFVVVPDRRYHIECVDASLRFRKTGSQFDVQWLVRGARSVLGERVAQAFERSSRGKLLLGGIGLAALSALALLLAGGWAVGTGTELDTTYFKAMGVLVLAFVVGVVMLIAAIASHSDSASGDRHDFDLQLADVVEAALLPPQSEVARRGEPQVARVHLEAPSHGTIRLGIPTDADLEAVKRVIPKLAA